MAEKELTEKEATGAIASLIREAEAKLREASSLADEYEIDFRWKGPYYGMGGHYSPKPADWDGDREYGWNSSSSEC